MSSPSTVSNVARCAGKPGSEYIFPLGAPSPPPLTCVTPRSLADKRPQSSRGKRVEAIRSRNSTGKSRSKVCSDPYFRTPISDPLRLEAIRGRDATGESRSKVHSDPNFGPQFRRNACLSMALRRRPIWPNTWRSLPRSNPEKAEATFDRRGSTPPSLRKEISACASVPFSSSSA
jgi:hypothetical protein